MRIPYNWLKEFVDTKLSPKEAARVLTTAYHALDKPLYEQAGDTIMDLEDRGNRADVSGVIGIARDLSALTGEELVHPKLAEIPSTDNHKFPVKINISSDKVTRWRCVVYKDLKVADSPDWMKKRLEAYGIEPKNNVVDITNYVMVELGMPLHAFDLDKIDEVNLRMAKKGETLVTFEGTTLTFDENDLLAADSKKPLTLTTAIGGQESGVSSETASVLIEAGLYDQPTVRRSALRLNVRNESANRLGKYLHPEFCELAIARVIQLMEEVLNAKPESVSYDYYPDKYPEVKAKLTKARLDLISGEDIPLETAEKILKKLEFQIEKSANEKIEVSVPYFRTDVKMEDDLIEEVLRIKGYDSIPSVLPKNPPPKQMLFPLLELENKVKDTLVNLGFNEVISQQIIDVEDLRKSGYLDKDKEEALVKLENSWNSELNILRPILVTNLLKYYQSYKKHKVVDIRLFETGKVYTKNPSKKGFESYEEGRTAGILMNSDYLTLKGFVESLLGTLGIKGFVFKNTQASLLKNQFSAGIFGGEDRIGIVGVLKQKTLGETINPEEVSYCMLDLIKVSALISEVFPKASTKVENYFSEDYTFTLPMKLEVGDLLNTFGGEEITATLKEVYQDEKLERAGQKAVTINVRFGEQQRSKVEEIVKSVK